MPLATNRHRRVEVVARRAAGIKDATRLDRRGRRRRNPYLEPLTRTAGRVTNDESELSHPTEREQ